MSQGVPTRPMLTLSSFKSLEESNDLFDFDTFINEDNFVVNSTSHIYRNKKEEYFRGKKLQLVTKENAMSGDLPDFNYEMLFSVNVRQQDRQISYAISKPENLRDEQKLNTQLMQNTPFICLNGHGRSTEVNGYPLVEGDVIKMGKTCIKVLQTHLSNKRNNELPQVNQERARLFQNSPQRFPVVKTCRICLMQGDQHQEVISPCSCKGSCKFVHLSCLKTWFQNKVRTQNNRLVTSYHLSRFQCEICKTPLPNKITVKSKKELFVQLRKPDEPYIVLEKIDFDSQQKTLYVLTPRELGVRIGRGNTVDLRINDQTMSRIHAKIEFKRGEFILSDLGSRFGSLLMLQNQIKFDKLMCLQLRNKIYKLEVIPSANPRAQGHQS